MERCELCKRTDYHERHCPSNPAAHLFPRDSAFAQVRAVQGQLPSLEPAPDDDVAIMQTVASNRQGLEETHNEIGVVIEMLRAGDIKDAIYRLEDIQSSVYALLR